MNKSFSSFFCIVLIVLAVFSSTALAQTPPNFTVGDYVKYTIKPAILDFANHTTIRGDNNQESTLTWTITDIADSNLTVKLSLHIPVLNSNPLDYSVTLFVVDRKAYFSNGTEWGYIPFWINSDTKLYDTVNISGKDALLVTGNVTDDTHLKETPSNGWQEYTRVESDSTIKIFNFSITPYEYKYDKDLGILLVIGNSNDPVFLLFGDFIITGGLSLSSTNIDLGPQSNLTILVYLTQYWPIVLFVVIFAISFLVYWRATKRSKARRKH